MFKLGCTAFGGPAAHIAMMRREFVVDRRWVTEPEFVDMIGAANLVPGPSSTEVAIHLGYRRAGVPGLVAAGLAFIVPAALMVGIIAWAYQSYGALPQAKGILYGIKPVIIAIVGQAIYLLALATIKTWPQVVILAGSTGLAMIGGSPLAILFGSGGVLGLVKTIKNRDVRSLKPLGILLASVAAVALAPVLLDLAPGLTLSHTPLAIFIVFLKLGSVLYGGGYVLLAFLKADLIVRHAWLTQAQLLDATAVGQFTPGPVFTTATFIGYLLGGIPGAILATVGIFLPAFVFVALSGRLLSKFRESETTSAFLDGANAAALGLMLAVLVDLARQALVDPAAIAIAVVALGVLLSTKINSAWLVLAGAVVGFVLRG